MNSFLILIVLSPDTLRLDLYSAYKIALSYNLGYRIEVEKTDLQNVSFYKTIFSYMPVLSITGNYSSIESRFTPGFPGYTSFSHGYYITFNFSQKIFSPSSLERILNSFYSKKSQKFLEMDKKISLFTEILSAYVEFLKAKKFLEVKKKAMERAEENSKIFAEKYRLNLISKLDYLNSQVNLKQKEIDYKEALKILEDSKWKILLNLGIKEDKVLELEDIKIEVDGLDYDFENLLKTAERAKRSISSLKEEKKSSFFNSLFTSLSFLPEIEWGYYITYQDTIFPKNYNYFWNNSERSKGIYISFGLKFFNYPFDVIESRKNYGLQDLYLKKNLFDLYLQIENVFTSLNLEREKFALSLSALNTALEAYRFAEAEYKLGKISYVEFLNAEENMLNAELNYISSMYDYLKYKYNLLFLTGILEEEVK